MNMQRELQIPEEVTLEGARRDSPTASKDNSHHGACKNIEPRRIAVHSEELQKILDCINCDKEVGKAALAMATMDLRNKKGGHWRQEFDKNQ